MGIAFQEPQGKRGEVKHVSSEAPTSFIFISWAQTDLGFRNSFNATFWVWVCLSVFEPYPVMLRSYFQLCAQELCLIDLGCSGMEPGSATCKTSSVLAVPSLQPLSNF